MNRSRGLNEALQASESENQVRERCYQCFRPMSLCFCEAIPQIENRTDVLILQHVGERFHPFNTARIVQKALRHCHVITDHNQRLGTHPLPIQAHSGLLYPRANAPLLTELSAAERPSQLVIVDGTWHQAKTIVRDVPQLRDMPCYRLTPASPGQYRIRREPSRVPRFRGIRVSKNPNPPPILHSFRLSAVENPFRASPLPCFRDSIPLFRRAAVIAFADDRIDSQHRFRNLSRGAKRVQLHRQRVHYAEFEHIRNLAGIAVNT